VWWWFERVGRVGVVVEVVVVVWWGGGSTSVHCSTGPDTSTANHDHAIFAGLPLWENVPTLTLWPK